MTTGIVWFRRDLRLDDNPAWAAATGAHDEVIALYVIDPGLFDRAATRRCARLLGDLHGLDARLAEHGGRLLVRTGDPREIVISEAERAGASVVHCNADVTPYATRRDDAVRSGLARIGTEFDARWGILVHEPGRIRTNAGGLSQVFTPFFRTWDRTDWTPWPSAGDATIRSEVGDGLPEAPTSYPVLHGADAHLVTGHVVSEAEGEPGEPGALARLEAATARADSYDDERNTPAIVGTSELSIDLRFGTVSPRTVAEVVGVSTPGRAALVRQLAWRDWYAHLLLATPALVDEPMKPQYAAMQWRDDDAAFAAWKEGRTGYPFVDAGMRQLRSTGWMHNRVRMVTASFLVKNLLIDWRRGERYFRHVLLDGDVSQNVGNWQWVAGTGPDASPYNRVFNPVLQGQRFDADGEYIRRWVPELASITGSAIHEPWLAGPLELAAGGVVLGDTYPAPIVDLAESRARVLAAYDRVRHP